MKLIFIAVANFLLLISVSAHAMKRTSEDIETSPTRRFKVMVSGASEKTKSSMPRASSSEFFEDKIESMTEEDVNKWLNGIQNNGSEEGYKDSQDAAKKIMEIPTTQCPECSQPLYSNSGCLRRLLKTHIFFQHHDDAQLIHNGIECPKYKCGHRPKDAKKGLLKQHYAVKHVDWDAYFKHKKLANSFDDYCDKHLPK